MRPRTIGQRLADGHVEAILTHELCHVRRRDNLGAALHMMVEAMFWFHPLIWWIEKRLVDERERACDEEVVRLGSDPQLYAESILKTCEFYAESPLVCVAGVTGSDLKKRVEAIMRGHSGQELKPSKRILLATVGVLTVALPVSVGVLNGGRLRAQTLPTNKDVAFEVASIKVNKSNDTFKGVQAQPGGQFAATNLTLRELIGTAYEIPPPLRKARMSGGPGWIDADRFDIVAKAEAKSTLSQHLAMLRALLADRFKLVARTATREMPVYALVVARSDRKLGPQLRKVPDVDCAALRAASRGLPPPPPPSPGVAGPCSFRVENRGLIMSGATTMTDLVRVAFPRMVQDRVVVDRTGLVGSYSVNVEWTPEAEPFVSAAGLPPGLPVPPPPTTSGPSIFTALQEQLGLKLESARAEVEVLVIDRVERPTPD